MPLPIAYTAEDYTVGWVCALPIELAAAKKFLDSEHQRNYQQRAYDDNEYILGNIAHHNVVLVVLPQGVYGKVSAATVAQQMRATFTKIKLWLMVGVGGGVPSHELGSDVRLGDVVVSTPSGSHSGVIQYDLGKTLPDGRVQYTGSMNSPHPKFLAATGMMKANQAATTRAPDFDELVRNVIADPEAGDFHRCYPGPTDDRFFHPDYKHQDAKPDCTNCDTSMLQIRKERPNTIPRVHYGLIASGDQVVKDAKTRDKLAKQFGVKCFEMEAAGMMNSLGCLSIRGICDYCDSHKCKDWQPYAALVAAAYAKTLLQLITADERRPAAKTMRDLNLQKRTQLLSWWISGCAEVDTTGDLEVNTRLRHGDTCSWLFRDERFQNWRDDLNSKTTMWYSAPIGSGKTVLSAAVVEHLKVLDRNVVYFCYSFKSKSRREFSAGLRALAVQLINLPQDEFPTEIEVLQGKQLTEENAKDMPDSLARTVFNQALRPFNRVYVVIDGLDECGNEKVMLQEVASLISEKRLGVVKWFITSRDERRIRDMFTKLGVLEVAPTREVLWWDINQYLSSALGDVDDIQTPVSSSKEPETDKISQWTTICDGNFLYSKFVLETLQEHHSVAGRRKLLAEFPKDLQGWYLRTLAKLCDETTENRELIRRTFVYLVYANKSMTWEELQHALSIDRSSSGYDKDYLIKKARIQQLCGAFLQSEKHATTETTCSETVRLSHKTVHDFLLQDTSGINFADAFPEPNIAKHEVLTNFFPNAEDASKEIGMDCLWYLNYKRYREIDRAKEFCDGRQEDDTFLKYAAAFWFRALGKEKLRPGDEPTKEVCRFLESPNFWTAISVQTFIAPYLFTKFRQHSNDGFYMDISQPGSDEPAAYGHPVPEWLDKTECGKKLDWDFCHFVTDWYEVLASHPGQLAHCIPLREMPSGLGRHLNSHANIKTCQPFEQMACDNGAMLLAPAPIFHENALHVEMIKSERPAEVEGDRLVQYCRGQAFGKGEIVKQRIRSDALKKGTIVRFSYSESDSTVELWYLHKQPLLLERIVDNASVKFEAPPSWDTSNANLSWMVTGMNRTAAQSGDVSIIYFSKLPSKNKTDSLIHGLVDGWFYVGGAESGTATDNESDGDSDHEVEQNAASDDESDNESDDESDDNYDDMDDTDNTCVDSDASDSDDLNDSEADGYNTSDSGCFASQQETEGVLLIRKSAPPLWLLLGRKDTDAQDINFAFRPNTNDVVWKSADADSSFTHVEGYGAWQVHQLPGNTDAMEGTHVIYQGLHFSACGEYLYKLEVSMLLKPDLSCQVSLHSYHCPSDDSSAAVQMGPPQQITYRVTKRLHMQPLDAKYMHWGDGELVMALPPLTCKPKIIKFTLRREVAPAAVEILNDPIYLPATVSVNTALRYQPGLPGKKHQLFLYFLRRSKGTTGSRRGDAGSKRCSRS